MAGPSDDGKIRIRCSGCGKRVKFSGGTPGATFRCPLCKTTMVAPLGDQNPEPPTAAELRSVKTAGRVPAQPTEPAEPRRPQAVDLVPRDPAIDRVNKFLARETLQIGRVCMQVLADETLSQEQKGLRLRDLRHTKAVHLKDYVESMLSDMRKQMKTMHDDPASDTASGRERLAQAERELADLQAYLGVMFEYRGHQGPGGGPGTPGGASEPPTTP